MLMLNGVVFPIIVFAVTAVFVFGRQWYFAKYKVPTGVDIAIAAGVVVVAALLMFAMGHIPICKCGYVKIWHGVTYSSENSQHLTDWYAFSHIIHGIGFYALFRIGRLKKLPLGLAFIFAIALESAWEVFENTDFIINRYREVTISLDYYGDSIINSVFDIFAAAFGFVLAWRLPALASVAIVIALEVWVGYSIRDNLTLNIIMLIWPIEAVRVWQGSG